jgi:hypothetical protein
VVTVYALAAAVSSYGRRHLSWYFDDAIFIVFAVVAALAVVLLVEK